MNETEFSKQVIAGLKMASTFAYKVSDRFHAGVPDIYIASGTWMESKYVECSKSFKPLKLLRPEQKIWADKLTNAGDRVFFGATVSFSPFAGGGKRRQRFYVSLWDILPESVTIEDCHQTVSEIVDCLLR